MVNLLVSPVVVKDLMLCQHDTMLTTPRHEHFLHSLAVEDELLDQLRRSIRVRQVLLCHDLRALSSSECPEASVLELGMSYVVLLQVLKAEGCEVEGILESDLVLVEAKHVVEV